METKSASSTAPPQTTEHPVKAFLLAITDARKVLGQKEGRCVDAFLLKHGRPWRYVARGKYESPAGECYRNAFELADRYPADLVYVEGYASGIFPVMHAWCVARKTQIVIDPTWDNRVFTEMDRSYFGVPIKLSFVRKIILESKIWGGAIDVPYLNFPILCTPPRLWKEKLRASPDAHS